MSVQKVTVSPSQWQLETVGKRVLVSFFNVSVFSLYVPFFVPIFHAQLADFVVLWWGAYGGLAFDLQSLAKRIISLCCSASGCERNWSVFAHVSSYFCACTFAHICSASATS
jgi:hypothetical protein